jgi:hypothetical protein
MNHTPGPWIAEWKPNDDEDGPAAPGDIYYTGEFFRVLDVEDDPVEYISLSRPANARLVAAAPDMLEALKFVLSGPYSIMNTRHLNEVVGGAIAKAENVT